MQTTPTTTPTPHLGLVCNTDSEEIRYRSLTRKRFLEHDEAQRPPLLEALYRDNLNRLANAIQYFQRERIALYRIPSNLFPFADDPVGYEVLTCMADEVQDVGEMANNAGLRLVMHPEQFVVLSSDSPKVVENSVTILSMHAAIMDLLSQPRSPWALLEIHGGKSDRIDALIERIAELPEAVKTRIGLENDEYAYSAEEIHAVCRATGVPMIFDAHHHIVHEKLDSYEHPSVQEMLQKARDTWADPSMQLVHISNGDASFNDRRHAMLIETMPSAYAEAPWIEIEAKGKELAIQQLRQRA